MELYPHQEKAVEILKSKKRFLLGDSCGCVSGSTTLQINAYGRGFKISIKDLFFKNWDYSPGRITAKAFCDGELKQHVIKKVLFQGFKKVLSLTVSDKKCIHLTSDHEVLTKRGWIEAGKLRLTDVVATNGKLVCCECGSSERKICTYQYAKYKGMCTRCHQKKANSWKPGKHIDKDGYIVVSGLFDHPHARKNFTFPEHRLVMEKHLGRYLDPAEVVHHIDGNKENNSLSNLELLSGAAAHSNKHPEKKRHLTKDKHGNDICWIPKWKKVYSIRELEKPEAVFDLVMEDPYRNFVGNGIVVHNCGKSAVALRTATEVQAKKVLILGPKSSILSWRDQARLWTPGYFRVSTPTKTYDASNPHLLCVYNWDSLVVKRRIDFLLSIKWDMIIADESHRGIKNWSALRCKNFIFYLAPRAERILLMTGTPITKSASDLHPTLSLLLPGEIGKFSVFCEKYCNKNYHGFGRRGFDYVGFRNEGELHSILNSVMLRRTLEDLQLSLPPVIYKSVPLTVEPDVISQCLEINEDLIRNCIARGEQPPGHIMSVMRSVGMGKVAEAADYIVNLPSPVVVFATHIDVISELKELLLKAKLTVGVINGAVPERERGKIVEDFQAGELDVFIGNYAAAAEAITLTRSCNLVTLEYPWSPAPLEQAVHRSRRIGQSETLQVHNLVAEGSLDSVVLDSLRGKDLGIRKVINGS